jgi:ATP-dependent helicase HepA
MTFKIGQRWMSQTEPELGLGTISHQESKTVEVHFPEAQEHRTYGKKNAPLKRVCFEVGEEILTQDDERLEVNSITEEDGLLVYHCAELAVSESELSAKLQFSKPQERFLNGFIDSLDLYNLRRKTLKLKRYILSHPYRGLLGPKVSLIPHQLYVAEKVSRMHRVRVLLADEVGLGKTIEASLILNRLLMTSRASRVLIVLPDALVHQWFFELYRKFSLSFRLVNQETALESGENPFLDNEKVIVSMGLLKGSEIARDLMEKASFDILVVDEAHGLKVSENEKSFEFSLIEHWAQKVSHLILLSATPEQFGERAHFERLKLIDPEKFHSYDEYQKNKNNYQEWASILKEAKEQETHTFGEWPIELRKSFTEILQTQLPEGMTFSEVAKKIVDLYGPGRVYYRNIRKTMEREFLFFPKRRLYSYPIKAKKPEEIQWGENAEQDQGSFNAKLDWIKDLLSYELKDEKVLLISRSKKKILELEKKMMQQLVNVKVASFHSDLGLTARDRQAAYFADPEGAQLLLCTEVGSEGRNFEFCQNLILFDLPLHPLSLEQRIGRLDRIGQKRDIQIHVPYVEKTWEEVLFRWYRDGLEVFENSSEAAGQVFDTQKRELKELLENPSFDSLDSWTQEVRSIRCKFEEELEMGRDILVELNSYDPIEAKKVLKEIKSNDSDETLSDYMHEVFETLGVDVKELTGNISFIEPGDNMFVPVFPYLARNGQSVTFSRTQALSREELDFLTWDHPMPLGCMELILSQNYGSTSFVTRKNSKSQGQFYFETLYTFECPAPKELELEKFGVGEIFRILIDDKGHDLGDKWTEELVNSKIQPADSAALEKMKNFPRNLMDQLVRMSDKQANDRFMKIKARTEECIKSFYSSERQRLLELKKAGAPLCDSQIQDIDLLEGSSLKALKSGGIRLDSLRIIG